MFDNVMSKVRLAVGFPTHLRRKRERAESMRDNEQLWSSELEIE